MGGEAAKERRRLKRLSAQQQNDTAESAPAVVEKPDAKEGGKGSTAQQRLQRKLARKAMGTFRPQRGQSVPSPQIRKRKPESSNGTPVKKFKGGNNNASSKNVRNTPSTKKSNVGKTTATKRMNPKPKKPKHLKRKMEQLAQAMSGGGSGEVEESTVAQLEQQMQTLAKQMEEFKKIKSGKSNSSTKAQVVKDDTPKTAQSKEPDAESISDAELVHSEQENKTKCAPSSTAAEDDSSSDEDDIAEQANTRSRGKRRRGRRENNDNKHEDDNVEEDKMTKDEVKEDKVTKDNASKDSSKQSAQMSAEENSIAPRVTDDESKQSMKKTPKKDDKRRCIGRKPVTDFEIGKCYSGTVQYIKPHLGAFIDIGCHSDAFIHISCISDSYISSVEEVLNVGDEVENARVVAIDREKKRVTLSLRSEDQDAVKSSQKGKITTDAATEPVKENEEKTPLSNKSKEETLPVASSSGNKQVTETKAFPLTSGEKTGADLKRERKLARRAARRAEQNDA